MNYLINYALLVFLMALLILGCSKTEENINPTSSFTVVNCMGDKSYLFADYDKKGKLRFDKVLETAIPPPSPNILYPFYIEKGVQAGKFPIAIYNFPDTLKPAIELSKNLEPGGIYSLFVSGKRGAIDTLFLREKLLQIPVADSVLVFRIIDLAHSAYPLSVNLKGNITPIKNAESLLYKDNTGYFPISVKGKTKDENVLLFELRNASNNVLLDSFFYNWRNQSENSESNKLSMTANIIVHNDGNDIKASVIVPQPN